MNYFPYYPMIELATYRGSDEQRPSDCLSLVAQADACNTTSAARLLSEDPGRASAKAQENDSANHHFGCLDLIDGAGDCLSHVSKSIASELAPISDTVGHGLHNASDVVQALGKGAYDSAVAPVVHGLTAAGQWVEHNPLKTLEIGGAVAGAAAVEVLSGGLATEAVIAALPTVVRAAAAVAPYVTTVGRVYATGVTIEAGIKVARHGELGTILSQNGPETPEEMAKVAQAKDELAKDTGHAVVSDLSLFLGCAVSRLVSRGNAEVVDEATALVLVEQMSDSAIKTGLALARAGNNLGAGAYQITDGATRIWDDAENALGFDVADASPSSNPHAAGKANESPPGQEPSIPAALKPAVDSASDATLASTIGRHN